MKTVTVSITLESDRRARNIADILHAAINQNGMSLVKIEVNASSSQFERERAE